MTTDNWISVNDRLPDTNKKFNESDYVLCYADSGQFVGWYNSELNQWFVSHYLAQNIPLSHGNIPTYWQPLPNNPRNELIIKKKKQQNNK